MENTVIATLELSEENQNYTGAPNSKDEFLKFFKEWQTKKGKQIGQIVLTGNPRRPIEIQIKKTILARISEETRGALEKIVEGIDQQSPMTNHPHYPQAITPENAFELVDVFCRKTTDINAILTEAGQAILDQYQKSRAWWRRWLRYFQS